MKNYDTFDPSNLTDLESWIIVAAAMWKMFTFFWPAVLLFAIFCISEEYTDRKKNNAKKLTK